MEVKTKRPLSVRALAVLLSVFMITGVFGIIDVGNFKASAVSSGDYEYEVLDDGTAIITNHYGWNEKIIIPSTIDGKKVTKIGDSAFKNSSSLISVDIPNSVTKIGDSAFAYCKNLTNVDIPNSVTKIGDSAFYDCESLISVDIPNSVITIGDAAFYDCFNLTSVNISNGVTEIGNNTFNNCSRLTSIVIPNSVTAIGYMAFEYCSSLTEVFISSNIEYIDIGAFADCSSLTNVSIPNGVKVIGPCVFAGCSSLTSVSIPDSVIRIEGGAFENCINLKSVSIPDSVKTIEKGAFYNCSSLVSVDIPNSVTEIEDSVFKNCDNVIIYGSAGSYAQTYAETYGIEFKVLKLKNNSTVTATSVVLGQGVTLKGVARGGTVEYQYAMAAKHSTASSYTVLKNYNSTNTKYWKPTKAGTYTVVIKVKDGKGEVAQKFFTIKVAETALKNKSTVTATRVVKNQGITLKGAATGGIGEYQYAMVAKHSTASSYTVLKNYDSTNTKYWKPSKSGTYTVVIKVKDSSGEVVQKFFTIKVAETALKNTSTVTATTVTLGQGITLKGAATGGTGEYQYAVAAKHSTASNYTVLKNYDSVTKKYWKPSKTGTYTVVIKVKDSSGKVVQKFFKIKVAETALKNTSTVTATTVTLGQGITLKGAATGGTGEYQYAIAAKHSTASKYTALKNYNSTATKYWKPSKAGTYTVVIKVKDSSGEVVQKFFKITVK